MAVRKRMPTALRSTTSPSAAARAAAAQPDRAGVAAAAEAPLAVDREHGAGAQARVRPGAGRLDALDAELHERDSAARGDAHRDRHAGDEHAVGAGHIDAGAVHALHAHLHAPPEGGHGFEHAAGHEQLGQLGQHGRGHGHASHASPEFGRDKRQCEQARETSRRNLRKARGERVSHLRSGARHRKCRSAPAGIAIGHLAGASLFQTWTPQGGSFPFVSGALTGGC